MYITQQESVTPQQLERISTAQLLVGSCLPVGGGEAETGPFIQNQNGCNNQNAKEKPNHAVSGTALSWQSYEDGGKALFISKL